MAWVYVLFFCVNAWRGKWFFSLCGTVVFMAVMQHPDMPKSMYGIQGFNLWNLMMLCVLLAWLALRSNEGHAWDMPKFISRMALLYLGVMLWSFIRLWIDQGRVPGATPGSLVSEYIINCYKWLFPGLIFYDACRTRKRIQWALFSILFFYFLLAVQVIKWVPIQYAAAGDELSKRASKVLENDMGYNRVNLSMMLSGACWAVLATLQVVSRRFQKLAVAVTAGTIALGQALTGGRTGYVTWALVGFILSMLRWRKRLLLIPVVVLLIALFLPGVPERLFTGMFQNKQTGEVDQYAMTSGRNVAWPYVIEKINKSPITGYGRLAMVRTGLRSFLWVIYGEEFPHPHNAYLEMLLDNGILGFLLVVPFFLVLLFLSIRLLMDKDDLLCSTVGGVAASLILALLVASFGSQTFYPREGAVGMWAAIGIMLRVYVLRYRPGRRAEQLPEVEETRHGLLPAGNMGLPKGQ